MSSVIKVDAIQNQSGTSAMTVNSNGSVIRSVIPRWKARTGPSTSAGSYGNDTIGAREVHDPLNNYDPSTRKYTVPVTGCYAIFMQALLYSNITGSLYLRVNGTNAQTDAGYTYSEGLNVGNTTISWSTYIDLSAGDEIDVYASGAGAWYSNGSDNYTYWGGYLIG